MKPRVIPICVVEGFGLDAINYTRITGEQSQLETCRHPAAILRPYLRFQQAIERRCPIEQRSVVIADAEFGAGGVDAGDERPPTLTRIWEPLSGAPDGSHPAVSHGYYDDGGSTSTVGAGNLALFSSDGSSAAGVGGGFAYSHSRSNTIGNFLVRQAVVCNDADEDGYRSPGDASCPNGAAQDCNDNDPDISPAAFELPGNLADENCDGDLGPCCPFLEWRNHGQYVRCVAQDAEALVEAGLFTQDDADALVSSSAQTEVGKKDFVADPAQCSE